LDPPIHEIFLRAFGARSDWGVSYAWAMHAIYLDPETAGRLDLIAARVGRSRESIVKEAIEEYIEDLEDGLLALDRLNKPGRIFTSEEVKRAL
jgi:predicted DNA-binding protein